MFKILFLPFIVLFLFDGIQNPKQELDAFWEEASRTVEEGDFEGYANTFHPDAILVNGISGNSYPISNALQGWKQGFDDTKAGEMKASVEFRFQNAFTVKLQLMRPEYLNIHHRTKEKKKAQSILIL